LIFELANDMPSPAKYVQPIPFEDSDVSQFERLVFAYHARIEKWKSLEWHGQSGSNPPLGGTLLTLHASCG
jgi:hypothetical protein